jgi:Txe/YoeB family toxin of toxin-antitoxin system
MPESDARRVTFHPRARKDNVLIARAGLQARAQDLIGLLRRDPFESPPPFEKLLGEIAAAYSRRLTIKHRIVYTVRDDLHEVRILRMWTHYE